jgi:hypothetical protein
MADKKQLGVGLDIGTMNLVAARKKGTKVGTSRLRDAFLDLPVEAKKRLKLSGVNYIEPKGDEESIIVVGDAALEMANIFGQEVRRPLARGLISAGEFDALEVLGILVKNVLGEPGEEDEVCYFSVPAAPVDEDRDVVYHQGVFERIVEECGYEAYPSNEAMAIIFSETAKDGFSGLAISFGSGMCNIALAINGVEGLVFSVARGGDWIDGGAAKAVGSTSSRMCAIKEKTNADGSSAWNLASPEGREQEALALYYKALIEYCIDNVAGEFNKIKDRFSLPKPIPIVLSGGTAMAGGFLEFTEKVFKKKRRKFPFEVSEIRMASDPLNAVARGLLVQAMQEYDEE